MISLACAAASRALFGQQAGSPVHVAFEDGHMTRSFEDAIDGFNEVSYRVTLHAGQTLRISLASNNISNCFDVFEPGAAKPFYLGGDSGNTLQMVAKASGDYLVNVFLLRLAARDNQSAQFTLELRLLG